MADNADSEYLEYDMTWCDLSLTLYLNPVSAPDTEEGVSDRILHTHLYTELFVCTRGSIRIRTEQTVFTVPEGSLLAVPPGIRHIRVPSSGDCVWCCFGFSAKQVRAEKQVLFPVFRQCFLGQQLFFLEDVPELCESVCRCCRTEEPIGRKYRSCHLLHVLAEIMERAEKAHLSDAVQTPDTTGSINRLSMLDQILASEFTADINAQTVAQRVFMSERQLDRVARKRYGGSVHQIITEKRTDAACELLRCTELSAERIGGLAGFPSKSCFYREFSKRFGMTPLQYRKRNQG